MKISNRRKLVMQRSMRLGHCICDPRKNCPCELFKEKNLCLCAGERAENPAGPLRLTQLIEKTGCASKIDQAFLKQVLKDLPASDDPRVLVGFPAGDDAGIYDLGSGKALVQTVDVFTPSVDEAYTFGQVAAANSLSDIYAMGGKPLTALSIIGFPARKVPDSLMRQILQGGIDKMNEASVAIIGGHSIDDDQIKAGFAVTGLIEPDKIITNAAARPDDLLILTKPIGTGIITFAAQIDRAELKSVEAATESMTALNNKASRLMVEYGSHSCTDITGFGLMGHITEMALSSGVDVQIIWDEIPLFPFVLEYAAEGIIPGAVERNKESCGERILLGENVSEEMADICFDAQTSGGLLIAIEKNKANDLLSKLHNEGLTGSAIIGKVVAKGSGKIYLNTNKTRKFILQEQQNILAGLHSEDTTEQEMLQECSSHQKKESTCCDITTPAAEAASSNQAQDSEIEQKFQDFFKSANAPGELDVFTKQAMAIALSVLARCEPCLKTHIKKARNMGFSQKEIDEAAWMAIAFGGSSAMMFYNNLKNT